MRQLIASLSLFIVTTLQAGAQSYCAPATSFGCGFGDQIVNFSTTGGTTNISNLNSGCSSGHYSYDSTQAVTAEIGGSFDFQVQSGPTFNQGQAIWIDWNQDYDFDDAGEHMWTSTTWSTQLVSGSIQIPTTQAGGTYRMRVRCSYNSLPTSPCDQQTYGETEDYNVILEVGSEVIGICYGDIPPAFNNIDSAVGGSGNYSYSWEQSNDMGGTWANAVGKYDSIAYDYGLNLIDTLFFRRLVIDQSCSDSAYSNVIEIHVPDSLQLDSVSITNATCFGTATGSIDMSISGGALPYSYSWSDGDSIQDPINLAAGTYTVTVTDNFNCFITRTFTVQEPDSLIVDALANNNVSCNGFSDAIVSAQITGGTGPFSYSWNNGDTTATSDSLSIGTYTVTITDASGCTALDSIVVTEPTVLMASSSVAAELSCIGANDGSVTATGSGGTAPYSYLWNNGGTNATISSLDSGSYSVTITDANGCTATSSSTIILLDTIKPSISTQTVTVYLDVNGQGSVTASQVDNGTSDPCGIASISISQSNFDCTHIGSNTITFYASDVNGNNDSTSAIIMVMDTVKPAVITQDITIYLDGNGEAQITTTDVDNGSNDACGIQGSSLDSTDFNSSEIGSNTVTLTATDVNANSASATATVVVVDTLTPIAKAQNLTVYLDQNGTISITPQMADNGSTDNSPLTFSLSQSTFGCGDEGLNLETLTVTDAGGNVNSATFLVDVKDTIRPTLLTQSITVQLGATGQASIAASQLDNGSFDNCANQLFYTTSQTSFDCTHLGVNIITITITDTEGNTTTGTDTVFVEDNLIPTAQAQNISLQLDANGQALLTPQMLDNGSSDNCSVDSLWISQSTFSCSDLGANSVALSVQDPSGNVSITNAIVTVEDNLAPVAQAQNVTIYLDGNGSATLSAQTVDNGSSDNCSISTLSIGQSNFDCSDLGANTITFSAQDASGNSNSTSLTVTVLDTNKPMVVTQNITVQLDQNGSVSITPQMVDNGSTDNCNIQSMSLDQTTFSCSDIDVPVTVSLTITDNSGNMETQTAQITVLDQIAPIAQAQNLTIYLDASGSATITPQMVDNGSSDNCAIDSLNLDISVFDCADLGQNLITLSVTDSSGNASSTNAFITILDTITPSIDNLPNTITAYTTANQCATTVQWPALTASDNCNTTFINTSQINGGLFNKGTTAVLVNAFDASGNSITQSFDVVVLDTVSPVITGLPFTFNITPNTASCDAVVSWIAPTAFDNCGAVTITSTHSPGATFAVGTTTVSYTATDGDGNSSTASFDVTVNDVIDPTINSIPADITQAADAGNCSAVVSFTAPTVTDNCTGATLSSSHTSGSIFPVGVTTVSYTATDAAGNTSQGSFDITVTDNEKPVVLSVPANDTVGPCNAAYVYTLPTASDNCGNVTVTQLNGLPSGNVFPVGITQNTFRISDDAGNDTVVSFTIVIVPQGQPQLPNLLEICANAPEVDIALGQNIVWTGNGATNNGTVFSPAQAGVGRHSLSYSFTDDQGCVATGSITVTVLPVPTEPVIVQIASTTLSTQGAYASYQWYKNGIILNGETLPTLNYSTAGNYQVVVGNVNGCEVYGEGFVVGANGGSIGLDENILSQLAIYPNPTRGRVTIDLKQFHELEVNITLHSIDGRKLMDSKYLSSEEGQVELDLSHLPRATYFMQISGQQHAVVRKIIIQ